MEKNIENTAYICMYICVCIYICIYAYICIYEIEVIVTQSYLTLFDFMDYSLPGSSICVSLGKKPWSK